MNDSKINFLKNIFNIIPLPKWIKKLISLYAVPKSVIYAKNVNGRISYSEVGQDIFVLETLKDKRNGFYIELGANDPICNNNTFTLEKNYLWRGISFEIVPAFVFSFNFKRRNRCIQADATIFDYAKYFADNNVPSRIDYLQVDIDPSVNSLNALMRLPFDHYRFSIITFEHDRYSSGDLVMLEARKFLRSFGYRLEVPNVTNRGRDFEDWWIDEKILVESRTQNERL
jgi:hypothetical protein